MNVFHEGWIDNIGGTLLAFGLIACLTWYLTKLHNIDIKEFFGLGKQNEKK